MSNPDVIEKIANKLSNLRTSILEGQVKSEDVIAEKLAAIREYAEKNEVAFIIDDEEYIELLSNPNLGEEESEEYSQSYDYDDEEESGSY